MYLDGFLYGLTVFVFFVVMYVVRKIIHKEGLSSFLIHLDKRGIMLLLKGLLYGLTFILIYIITVVILREGEVSLSQDAILNTFTILLVSLFIFTGVALFEESLYRGYILQKMQKRFSIVVSILVPAVLFSAWHFISYSTNTYFWIGLLNAFLFAIVMSLIVLVTDSLMMSIGFHIAWNVVQGLIFSVQNLKIKSLINLRVKEGIVGGGIGNPESGLIVSGMFVSLLIYYISIYIKINKSKEVSTRQ